MILNESTVLCSYVIIIIYDSMIILQINTPVVMKRGSDAVDEGEVDGETSELAALWAVLISVTTCLDLFKIIILEWPGVSI